MRFGSLFTGIGGFDLAFERAGMECAWQCEIDKNCLNVLEKHWPKVRRYTDVREITAGNTESVDLICGGFPCQDLSIAGKREGLAGERSGLWFEFERIIGELKPKWVVIENVPGLLSSNTGRDFAVILQALVEFGYGVSWWVLDAQYFGVPQRRRRVFIVGHLGDGRAAEVLFESDCLCRDTAKGEQEGKAVATTIAGGSDKCHSDITSGQQDGNLIYADKVAPTLASSGSTTSTNQMSGQLGSGLCVTKTRPIVMSTGQANAGVVIDGSPSITCAHEQPIVATSWTLRQGCEGGGKGYLELKDKAMTLGGQQQNLTVQVDGSEQASTLRGFGHGWQGQHNTTNAIGVWQMDHASEAYRDCGEISPTLQQRMGTGGNQVPLVGIRRLTPMECARLQGFPDTWNDWLSDTQRYRQFGNAVAVPVVEWIGRRIMEAT